MATLDMVLDAVVAKVKDAVRGLTPAHKVFPGWPLPEQLSTDLASKTVVVSVYNNAAGDRRTTRHVNRFSQIKAPVVNLSAKLLAPVFQFGTPTTKAYGEFELSGSVAAGTLLLVELFGHNIPYHPDPTYSIEVVAQGLVDVINAHPDVNKKVVAAHTGATVTITALTEGPELNGLKCDLHIGGSAELGRETKRQNAPIEIHVWAYDNTTRALFANTIDDALDDLNFLPLPDGTAGRLLYSRTVQTDLEIKHGVFRRILHYTVEYVSTQVVEAPQVLAALVTYLPNQQEGNA